MMPLTLNLGRKCWWSGPDGQLNIGEVADIYSKYYVISWVDAFGQAFTRHVRPDNIIFA